MVVALLSCKAEVKYDPAVVLPKAISDAINTLGNYIRNFPTTKKHTLHNTSIQ